MNLEQIAPCPFCGKSETVELVDSDTFQDLMPWEVEPEGHMLYWAVMCDASKPAGKGGCGASGGFMPTQEAAAERWNIRPDNDHKARALMYERTNAEQAAMLNKVIAERDGLLAGLQTLIDASGVSDDCCYGTLGSSFVRDIARAAIGGDMAITDRQVDEMCSKLRAAFNVPTTDDMIRRMVDRFLSWPLPKGFSPDCGINFDGRKDDEWNKNKTWPIGTNLFNAEQAREMVEHMLGDDSMVKDAQRYRFVRSADRVAISTEAARNPIAYDAAIDAAIAKSKP